MRSTTSTRLAAWRLNRTTLTRLAQLAPLEAARPSQPLAALYPAGTMRSAHAIPLTVEAKVRQPWLRLSLRTNPYQWPSMHLYGHHTLAGSSLHLLSHLLPSNRTMLRLLLVTHRLTGLLEMAGELDGEMQATFTLHMGPILAAWLTL